MTKVDDIPIGVLKTVKYRYTVGWRRGKSGRGSVTVDAGSRREAFDLATEQITLELGTKNYIVFGIARGNAVAEDVTASLNLKLEATPQENGSHDESTVRPAPGLFT